MSKELEALKRITNEISNYKLHGIGDENWLGIQDVLSDVKLIEQALTPPTEQEVCKALSDYYGKEVIYENQHKEFRKGFRVVAYPRDNIYNEFDLLGLPPHLVEMIGKFYKGKVKE